MSKIPKEYKGPIFLYEEFNNGEKLTVVYHPMWHGEIEPYMQSKKVEVQILVDGKIKTINR